MRRKYFLLFSCFLFLMLIASPALADHDCSNCYGGEYEYCRRWNVGGNDYYGENPSVTILDMPDVIYYDVDGKTADGAISFEWEASNKVTEGHERFFAVYWERNPPVDEYERLSKHPEKVGDYRYDDFCVGPSYCGETETSVESETVSVNLHEFIHSGGSYIQDAFRRASESYTQNPDTGYVYIECVAQFTTYWFGRSCGTGCGRWVQIRPLDLGGDFSVSDFVWSYPSEVENNEEFIDVLTSFSILEDGIETSSAYDGADIRMSLGSISYTLPLETAGSHPSPGFAFSVDQLGGPGDYTLTCKIFDKIGSNIFTRDATITITEAQTDPDPEPDPEPDPDQNEAPKDVTLSLDKSEYIEGDKAVATVSFSDDGPDPWEIEFDWGDGTSITKSTTSATYDYTHEYRSAGQYSITVTVTDADGKSGSKSKGIEINEADGPGGEVTPNCAFVDVVLTYNDESSQNLAVPSGNTVDLEWEVDGCLDEDFDRIEIYYGDTQEYTSELNVGSYPILAGEDTFGYWSIEAYNADGVSVPAGVSLIDGGVSDGGDNEGEGGDSDGGDGDSGDGDSGDGDSGGVVGGGVSAGDPTITISLSKTTIIPGEISTLTWSTTDAVDLEITGSGIIDAPSSFSEAEIAMGALDVRPQSSTTYNFTVTGDNGNIIYKTKTLFVEKKSAGSDDSSVSDGGLALSIDPVLLIGGGIALVFVAFNLIYFQLKKEFPPYFKLIEKLKGSSKKKKSKASGFSPYLSTEDYDIGLNYSADSNYPQNPYYRSMNKNKKKK